MWKKVLHFLDMNLELILGGTCLALMAIFTFLNIVLRLLFKNTLPWLQEITRYLFVWMVFISIGAVVREKGHIRITFIQTKFKGKALHILEIIVYVISIIFGCIIAYYSVPLVASLGDMRASSMQWYKMSYLYAVLPVGMLSFVLRNIQMIILEIREMKREESGAAPETGEEEK